MNPQEPLSALAEIRQLMDGSSWGADGWARKRVLEACLCLEAYVPKMLEQIREIDHWADVYFTESPRHQYTPGQIAGWVNQLCWHIESHLPPETPC